MRDFDTLAVIQPDCCLQSTRLRFFFKEIFGDLLAMKRKYE